MSKTLVAVFVLWFFLIGFLAGALVMQGHMAHRLSVQHDRMEALVQAKAVLDLNLRAALFQVVGHPVDSEWIVDHAVVYIGNHRQWGRDEFEFNLENSRKTYEAVK